MHRSNRHQNYLSLLTSLQAQFGIRSNPEQIAHGFIQRLTVRSTLTVIFDNTILDVMAVRLRNIVKESGYTERVIMLIVAYKKCLRVLQQEKFITNRAARKMLMEIVHYEQRGAFKLAMALPYLHHAVSTSQFRLEFLQRIMNSSDDEEFQTIAKINCHQSMSRFYQQFVTEAISNREYDAIALNFFQTSFCKFEAIQEMLSCIRREQLYNKIGNIPGATHTHIKINTELKTMAENNAYRFQSYQYYLLQLQIAHLQKLLAQFSAILNRNNNQQPLQFRLGKYGSLVSGFASHDADLDITILTDCYLNEHEFLKMLHHYLVRTAAQSNRESIEENFNLILNANTPLIKVTIIHHSRTHQPIKIDILVNNVLGIINSKFLSVYGQVDWIHHLGILVKMWGKMCGLISPKAFSSYALILMLLSYLIESRRVKVIMHHNCDYNDQRQFRYKRIKKGIVEQFTVYYTFDTESSKVTPLHRVNYLQVLKQFMLYFGSIVFTRGQFIVSIDGTQDKNYEKEYVYTIKDPFDRLHNPGRVKVAQKAEIITVFMNAFRVLQTEDVDRIKALFGYNIWR